MTKVKLTTSNSHRATQRGYGNGDVLVEAGEHVPAGTPVSENWMERVNGKKDAMLDAIDAALDPLPDDVELQGLDKAALQALCVPKGIDPKGLSEKQMVAALKAAHDPAR